MDQTTHHPKKVLRNLLTVIGDLTNGNALNDFQEFMFAVVQDMGRFFIGQLNIQISIICFLYPGIQFRTIQ